MLDIRWPLTWAPFPICVQVDRDHAQLKRQVALLPSFIFPRSNGVFCLSSASSVPTSSCTDSDTDEDLSPSPLALLLTFVNVRPIRRHIETLSLSGLGYFDFLRACPNQIRVGMDFLCLSFQTSLAWFARFKSDILHFGTRSAASVNVGFIKLEQVETVRFNLLGYTKITSFRSSSPEHLKESSIDASWLLNRSVISSTLLNQNYPFDLSFFIQTG